MVVISLPKEALAFHLQKSYGIHFKHLQNCSGVQCDEV